MGDRLGLAVFLSGLAFLILTAAGIRQVVLEAIPTELYAAVAAGTGLFIAMIGLRNAGIIVASQSTLVVLGNLRDKNTALALFGLALTAALLGWGFRAAMLLGVLATTLAGIAFGVVHWSPGAYRIAATAGKLNIGGAREIITGGRFVDYLRRSCVGVYFLCAAGVIPGDPLNAGLPFRRIGCQ